MADEEEDTPDSPIVAPSSDVGPKPEQQPQAIGGGARPATSSFEYHARGGFAGKTAVAMDDMKKQADYNVYKKRYEDYLASGYKGALDLYTEQKNIDKDAPIPHPTLFRQADGSIDNQKYAAIVLQAVKENNNEKARMQDAETKANAEAEAARHHVTEEPIDQTKAEASTKRAENTRAGNRESSAAITNKKGSPEEIREYLKAFINTHEKHSQKLTPDDIALLRSTRPDVALEFYGKEAIPANVKNAETQQAGQAASIQTGKWQGTVRVKN